MTGQFSASPMHGGVAKVRYTLLWVNMTAILLDGSPVKLNVVTCAFPDQLLHLTLAIFIKDNVYKILLCPSN